MDLEAESIVSIDTGMSSDIAESCNKLLDIQKKISTAEEEMKKLKEVETTLSEQTIPNLGNGATKPSRNWRLEESQKFTVAPAYNKGAYQVITKSNIKDIGK